MHNRCRNPNSVDYPDYGGRGIAVCDKWLSFTAFLADMGARPQGTTIDRVNPDGNYEPENCRWTDARIQAANKRASRVRVRQIIDSRILGIDRSRHYSGDDVVDILERLAVFICGDR